MTYITRRPTALTRRLCASIAFFSLLGLLLATSAWAGFNQVKTFAPGPGSQLAANSTGAGGAQPGTLYAGPFVYNTVGEAVLNAQKEPFEWEPEHHAGNALAVDQATGNVYIYTGPNHINVVSVSAEASHLITTFGAQGQFTETIEEGPDKFHNAGTHGGLAVDDSGDVYITDYKTTVPGSENAESRIMVFKPETPGDYEHYVYTGQIGFNTDRAKEYKQVSLDDAGNVYAATTENIYEFAPGQPNGPICALPGSRQIGQMTVDPQTGEVFYYDNTKRAIVQMNPCNLQGEFTDAAEIPVEPKPTIGNGLESIAFDPSVKYPAEGSRPESPVPGILYAVVNGTSNVGRIFAPSETPPVVEAEAVAAVTATTATVQAQVGSVVPQSRYTFQYITAAAYEANEPAERFAGAGEAPSGGAELGSGSQAQKVSGALTGLAPGTQYYVRVLASSHCDAAHPEKLCETAGEGRTFRTFSAEAAGLPDHRAYELVSPTQKDGGEVFPADPGASSCFVCKPGIGGGVYPRQSAPDGEAVVYEGFPFSFTGGALIYNEYLAKRGPSGWETLSLAPTLLTPSGFAGYQAFDGGLDRAVIYQDAPPSLAPSAPSEYSNLYTQPSVGPSLLTPLVSVTPPNREASNPGGGNFELAYAGASADFSRQFFAANDALTAATPFAPAALDGGPEKDNLYESHDGELRLVNVLPNGGTAPGASYGTPGVIFSLNSAQDLAHVISDDGSVAFWSDQAGQVYARVDGEKTIEIPDSAEFLTASADGSEVLLRDGHIYDLGTEQTTDLSAGQGGFQGIVGQSEDLSSVYFVDTAALTGEEENEFHAKAKAGEFNLYAWHEGVTSYIATLATLDNTGFADWRFSPAERSPEASADGRWLAFISTVSLTGYDNAGRAEIFLYEAPSHKLVCASCNPSEAPPLGVARLPKLEVGDRESPLSQPRYLLNNGRLYFDSEDSLSPFDTNNGVEDVYEYEPPAGPGLPAGDSCERESGCVKLISAGREPVDSNFLAVDGTGKNVFFTTRDQLVPKDKDALIDLYDAREYGGIPAESETGRRECAGEACQAPPAPSPFEPGIGSSVFSGTGSLVAPMPQSSGAGAKALTRAQKLTRALKACRKRPKRKRSACERTARRKYGKAKKSARRSHR